MKALLLAVPLLFACTPKLGPPPLLPAEPSQASARDVLRHNCGTCHRSDLEGHKEAALAVFDLNEQDWSRNIKTEQFDIAISRLSATAEQKAHFKRWVELERQRRASR